MSTEINKATTNTISTFVGKAAVHLDNFVSVLTSEKNAPFTFLTLVTAGTMITCKAIGCGYRIDACKGNTKVILTPPTK